MIEFNKSDNDPPKVKEVVKPSLSLSDKIRKVKSSGYSITVNDVPTDEFNEVYAEFKKERRANEIGLSYNSQSKVLRVFKP